MFFKGKNRYLAVLRLLDALQKLLSKAADEMKREHAKLQQQIEAAQAAQKDLGQHISRASKLGDKVKEVLS